MEQNIGTGRKSAAHQTGIRSGPDHSSGHGSSSTQVQDVSTQLQEHWLHETITSALREGCGHQQPTRSKRCHVEDVTADSIIIKNIIWGTSHHPADEAPRPRCIFHTRKLFSVFTPHKLSTRYIIKLVAPAAAGLAGNPGLLCGPSPGPGSGSSSTTAGL